MSDSDIPTKEIGEMLDTVTEKLPKLFKVLRESIFSAQVGSEIGVAVGNFYQALVEKGVPEDRAADLTTDYLRTLTNIGKTMKWKND